MQLNKGFHVSRIH